MSYSEKLGVTATNCKAVIKSLKEQRTLIGKQIENAEACDLDCSRLYNSYDEITDCINSISSEFAVA